MKVQLIQSNKSFQANNKVSRYIDYESQELLGKLLEKMDIETVFKSNEYR